MSSFYSKKCDPKNDFLVNFHIVQRGLPLGTFSKLVEVPFSEYILGQTPASVVSKKSMTIDLLATFELHIVVKKHLTHGAHSSEECHDITKLFYI